MWKNNASAKIDRMQHGTQKMDKRERGWGRGGWVEREIDQMKAVACHSMNFNRDGKSAGEQQRFKDTLKTKNRAKYRFSNAKIYRFWRFL